MCDAILLSGDEDLRVGVQQAQEFGVRVHLLGITPCRGSQSQFLMQEADTTHEWSKDNLSKFLTYTQRLETPTTPSARLEPKVPTTTTLVAGTQPTTQLDAAPPVPSNLSDFAKQAANEIQQDSIDGILASFQVSKVVPPEVDRPLLGRARRFFGNLGRDELRLLRSDFITALKARSGVAVANQLPKR